MSVGHQAIRVDLSFQVIGAGCEIFADFDPEGWPLLEDETANEALIPIVQSEIAARLGPALDHLAALGFIRADRPGENTPTFYAIVDASTPAALADLERLIEFAETPFPLKSLPGASLDIFTCEPVAEPAGELHATLLSVEPAAAIGLWGGDATPDRMPVSGENSAEWLARVALTAEQLRQCVDRWMMAGQSPHLYARCASVEDGAAPDWIVPGIIAAGVVTLIVGCGGTGKSSLCHELLSVAGGIAKEGIKTFLGQPVVGRYHTAFLCAEEPRWFLEYRRKRHEKLLRDCWTINFNGSGGNLKLVLDQISTLPPGVVVIDPAQVHMPGDDTKSHVASELYNPVVEFAERTGWAVVIVHHLVKTPVKTLAQMLPSVKGSTVHTDRPRMVIGMLSRSEDTVEIGPIKHNLPAELLWTPMNKGRLYRKDAETHTLVPIEVVAGPPPSKPSHDDPTYKAIARLNERGQVVRRTGETGLYECKTSELAGISRAKVQAAVAGLIEAGRVINTNDGLKAVLNDGARGEPTTTTAKE